VPQWLYNEVVEVKSPAVLTVHPEYFLIEPGIGRFLYRLARRAAGKARAKWSFQTIYERSGSTGDFKKFTFNLRRLIKANGLPEYTLAELAGKSGPLLVITHRDALPDELPELPEDDEGAEDDTLPPAYQGRSCPPRRSRCRAFVLRIEPRSESRPIRASIPFVMPYRQRCAAVLATPRRPGQRAGVTSPAASASSKARHRAGS